MTFLGTHQLTRGMRVYPNYGPGYTALWSSGTAGRSVDSLLVQDDGNVVLYGTGGQGALWSTGSSGTTGVVFKVQEDGNAVISSPNGALWSSGTAGRI